MIADQLLFFVQRFQQQLERCHGVQFTEIGQSLGHGLEERLLHAVWNLGLEQLNENFVGCQLVQNATQELAGDACHSARNVNVAARLPDVGRAARTSVTFTDVFISLIYHFWVSVKSFYLETHRRTSGKKEAASVGSR